MLICWKYLLYFFHYFQDIQQVCMNIMEHLQFAMQQHTNMIMDMLKMKFTQPQRVYTPNRHLCQDLPLWIALNQCTLNPHHLEWTTTTETSPILKVCVPKQALTSPLFHTQITCTKTTLDVIASMLQVSRGLWNLSQCMEHHTANKMILETQTTPHTEAQPVIVPHALQTQDHQYLWVEHAQTISPQILLPQPTQVLSLQTQQVCVIHPILSIEIMARYHAWMYPATSWDHNQWTYC